MSYDFAEDLSRLLDNPVSGIGKISAEKASKELYRRGVTLSAAHIRNLQKGHSPSNLSALELLALSDLLTGDKMDIMYKLGYFDKASAESFAAADEIYRRIYGN